MIADHGNDLRRAEEHVAEAQRIVHTQKGQLMRLKAAGRDTSGAERRLRLFESNLRRFQEHRNQLRQMNQLTRHPLIKSFLSALERGRAERAAIAPVALAAADAAAIDAALPKRCSPRTNQ